MCIRSEKIASSVTLRRRRHHLDNSEEELNTNNLKLSNKNLSILGMRINNSLRRNLRKQFCAVPETRANKLGFFFLVLGIKVVGKREVLDLNKKGIELTKEIAY